MDWGEWIEGAGSTEQWKSAAAGLSDSFTTPVRPAPSQRAYRNDRALWVEVRGPRKGVRLVAFRLPVQQGNTHGSIELRVWTSDAPASVHHHFDCDPGFRLQAQAWARYVNLQPSGSWENQLREKGVAVQGVAFSGKLSEVGTPENAVAVLRTLFESFCEFVIDRYEKGPTAKPEAIAAGTSAAPSESPEEKQISDLFDRLADFGDSERDAIVKARIGQSKFRDRLLGRWGGACSVTGLKNTDVLIASHIVPWSRCSTASERWDVDNGLLLTPSLDKAFELGYISFQHEGRERGRIVISPAANWDTRRRLGFDDPMLRIREWHEGLAHYLERHRTWWQLC